MIFGSGKLNIDLIYSGLERLPDEGEELYSDGFVMRLGGGAPATLVNLSRLGIETVLQTEIGADCFSEFASKELNKTSLHINNVYRDGFAVNITTAMLTPKDRTFVSYGEAKKPAPTMLSSLYDSAKKAKICVMEEGYLSVYKRLKSDGVLLAMDWGCNEKMPLSVYKEYFSVADYFLPNRKEALALTGESTVESAAKWLSDYFKNVIIKLDSEGCYVYSDGKGEVVPSTKVEHCDSTGAGDAFFAGFLYGLYKDFPVKTAVRCGNITGGKCVTDYGCLTAYYNEEELLRILRGC